MFRGKKDNSIYVAGTSAHAKPQTKLSTIIQSTTTKRHLTKQIIMQFFNFAKKN